MMRILLIIVFILYTGMPHAAIADELLGIEPPAFVTCENEANCDRDPKHLEAFVARFYEWYITIEEADIAIPRNVSPQFAKQ